MDEGDEKETGTHDNKDGGARGGTDDKQSNDRDKDNSKPGDWHEHPLGGDKYQKDLQGMGDRFNDWAKENGFERATNYREEVDRIIEKYRINTGDYTHLGEFNYVSHEQFSLLGGSRDAYHIERIDPRSFDFVNIDIFAWDHGYSTTSTIGDKPGQHGTFSFHYDGRAVDVSVKDSSGNPLSKEQIEAMKKDFESHGLRVYDETDRAKVTKETTAPHLHVDTGTQKEVSERHQADKDHRTRDDLGIGADWPLRLRK